VQGDSSLTDALRSLLRMALLAYRGRPLTMPMTRPFIVLGAGPAGLAAAITLARGGGKVEVIEQRADVGGRYGGNLQLLTNYPDEHDAWEELLALAPGIELDLWPQRVATLYGPSGKPVRAVAGEPFGYLLRRGPGERMLDGALRRVAEQHGVVFRFAGRGLPERAQVVATGGQAVQGVAREWSGRVNLPDGFTVLFDNRYCPGGFGYLVVAEGNAVLGAAVVKRHDRIPEAFQSTADWFETALGIPHIEAHSLVSGVDLFLSRSALGSHGEHYVGEAGGFCDFLFGFGIRLALQSGRLAAESLLAGSYDYDRRWRGYYGRRFEMGLANRFLYETFGHWAYRRFIAKAAKTDFRTLGCGLSRPVWWRRMLVPMVKRLWGRRTPCVHGERCAWCRAVK